MIRVGAHIHILATMPVGVADIVDGMDVDIPDYLRVKVAERAPRAIRIHVLAVYDALVVASRFGFGCAAGMPEAFPLAVRVAWWAMHLEPHPDEPCAIVMCLYPPPRQIRDDPPGFLLKGAATFALISEHAFAVRVADPPRYTCRGDANDRVHLAFLRPAAIRGYAILRAYSNYQAIGIAMGPDRWGSFVREVELKLLRHDCEP